MQDKTKVLIIVRYFVLYHHGGVFLDIDIDCHQSFDYIVQNISKNSDIVLGAIAPMGVTHNFLIAKGRHPFLWSVIHELANTNIWSFFSHYAISENTGPELVWRSYLNIPVQNPDSCNACHASFRNFPQRLRPQTEG